MSRYVDVTSFCENICRCNNRYCNKQRCPILNAPAADVQEIKHGKWIKMDIIPDDVDYYCSKCRNFIDIATGRETPIDRGFFYCPHCGAKMDGGNNNA